MSSVVNSQITLHRLRAVKCTTETSITSCKDKPFIFLYSGNDHLHHSLANWPLDNYLIANATAAPNAM